MGRDRQYIKIRVVCLEKKVKNPCLRSIKTTDQSDNPAVWTVTDYKFEVQFQAAANASLARCLQTGCIQISS
jgi:hypothetical protein